VVGVAAVDRLTAQTPGRREDAAMPHPTQMQAGDTGLLVIDVQEN
jgi:hypothetical protein